MGTGQGNIGLGAAPSGASSAGTRNLFALVAAGCALWLVHGVLVLIGVVSLLAIGLSGLTNLASLLAAASALLVAVGAVIVAALLLGVAMIKAPKTMGVPEARGKGLTVGILFILYAITGIVALAAALLASGVFATFDIATFLTLISLIVAAWAASAIVLAVTGFLVRGASTRLQLQSGGKSIFGKLFLAFAVVAAVGVLMLTLPLWIVGLGADLGSLAIVPILGLLLGLLVAPILAIVTFALSLRAALSARRMPVAPVAT